MPRVPKSQTLYITICIEYRKRMKNWLKPVNQKGNISYRTIYVYVYIQFSILFGLWNGTKEKNRFDFMVHVTRLVRAQISSKYREKNGALRAQCLHKFISHDVCADSIEMECRTTTRTPRRHTEKERQGEKK